MSWTEFLSYLRGPGVAAVVGVLLSYIVEFWPQYQSLESRYKRLVIAGLCFVVPVVATALSCASGMTVWGDWPDTWWPALVAGFVAFSSNQFAHMRKL
jgi:hypothetical protein